MIRVTFLGTAAARPTVGRNVSGLAVQRGSELMLFDCGEGTQRQMMRYGTGFSLQAVFITHVHADHFLGLTGLLRTLALQGRTDLLDIYGPPRSRGVLTDAVLLGVGRLQFPVEVHELSVGERVERQEYAIEAFETAHGVPSLGWALQEEERLGRFDIERARTLGIPEGPLLGRLHRGEDIEVEGRTIRPGDVVGPARPGRRIVYTGDTRPTPAVTEAARAADLLIHDATFADEEAERAHETHHTTALAAARLAAEAGARRLVLTHLSARYADAPGVLAEEARAAFPETVVAHDGMVIEVSFPDSHGDADEPGDGREQA